MDVDAAKVEIENQVDLIARGIERYHALLTVAGSTALKS